MQHPGEDVLDSMIYCGHTVVLLNLRGDFGKLPRVLP